MNKQFLDIKAQWAKILSLPQEPPKAPGMGNGSMLALGALFLGFLIISLVLSRC